jgi:ParB family transcriptional regulator, chromosome partitioning protein
VEVVFVALFDGDSANVDELLFGAVAPARGAPFVSGGSSGMPHFEAGGGEVASGEVAPVEVPLDLVSPNPYQPRSEFSPEGLRMLMVSIEERGLLQPISVVEDGKGGFVIVSGERRFRAVEALGWRSIPAFVRSVSDDDSRRLALIENLQREDLNPYDMTRLVLEFVRDSVGVKNVETVVRLLRAAKNGRVKHADSEVTQAVKDVLFRLGIGWLGFTVHKVRLLSLPADVVKQLVAGRLSASVAVALGGVEDDKRRKALVWKAASEGLSLSQVKALVAGRVALAGRGGFDDPLLVRRRRLVRQVRGVSKVVSGGGLSGGGSEVEALLDLGLDLLASVR